MTGRVAFGVVKTFGLALTGVLITRLPAIGVPRLVLVILALPGVFTFALPGVFRLALPVTAVLTLGLGDPRLGVFDFGVLLCGLLVAFVAKSGLADVTASTSIDEIFDTDCGVTTGVGVLGDLTLGDPRLGVLNLGVDGLFGFGLLACVLKS